MSKFKPNKVVIGGGSFTPLFNMNKSAVKSQVGFWKKCIVVISGDFDLEIRQRPGRLQKFEVKQLDELGRS